LLKRKGKTKRIWGGFKYEKQQRKETRIPGEDAGP